MTRRPIHPRGFTLLELVLVMVIMVIAMGMMAPSLRGWSHGSKIRDAGDQFLAVARYGQTQAAANGQIYRLNVDSNAGTYFLTKQDGQQFINLGNEFGRVFAMPDGFRIAMTDEQQQPLALIDFYPTGRSRAAHVRIAAATNEVVDIDCPSPAEGFRIVTGQEQAR
jgi:prepilin-type N-terminal cleavage/methylation domain-containing protein